MDLKRTLVLIDRVYTLGMIQIPHTHSSRTFRRMDSQFSDRSALRGFDIFPGIYPVACDSDCQRL